MLNALQMVKLHNAAIMRVMRVTRVMRVIMAADEPPNPQNNRSLVDYFAIWLGGASDFRGRKIRFNKKKKQKRGRKSFFSASWHCLECFPFISNQQK